MNAGRAYDCATPGCDGETTMEAQVCSRCFLEGRNPPWTPQPQEEADMTPELTTMCRKGCGRPAEPRSIGMRGRYGNLCAQCRADERTASAAAQSGRPPWNRGRRGGATTAGSGRPPALETNGADRVQAARRLLAAAEQLQQAQAEYEQALGAVKTAR